jgi:hypothetical protein
MILLMNLPVNLALGPGMRHGAPDNLTWVITPNARFLDD